MFPNRSWLLPLIRVGRPARSELKRLRPRRSSRGSTLYFVASMRNSRWSSCELVGVLGGQVVGLGPVGGRVVELPDVVVEGRHLGRPGPTACEWRVTAVQPLW